MDPMTPATTAAPPATAPAPAPQASPVAIADAVARQVLADAANPPAGAATPPATAPAGTPPPAEQEPTNYTPEFVAQLRAEAKTHRERAQVLDAIPDQDKPVVMPLLQALAQGNAEYVQNWIYSTYHSMFADDADPGQPDLAPSATPPANADQLTPETVQEIVRQAIEQDRAEREQQQIRYDAVNRMNDDLRSVGVDPASATARAVVAQGMKMQTELNRPVLIPEAFAAWKAELAALGLVPGAAPAPPVVPGQPAPSGVAPSVDIFAGKTPEQRAMYRLTGRFE